MHTSQCTLADLHPRRGEVLSDELLNGFQRPRHSQLQAVAIAIPALQLLRGAQAAEGAVDHDAHPGAQRLALRHAVRGEEHRLASTHHTPYHRPQELAGAGVHSGGGLVLEKVRWGRGRGGGERVPGSAVGSSRALTRSSRRGVPRRAMAAESFLRLPPEYWPAGLSACTVRSSLCRAHSTTCGTCSHARAGQAVQLHAGPLGTASWHRAALTLPRGIPLRWEYRVRCCRPVSWSVRASTCGQ